MFDAARHPDETAPARRRPGAIGCNCERQQFGNPAASGGRDCAEPVVLEALPVDDEPVAAPPELRVPLAV
jgi:hypothetical protein